MTNEQLRIALVANAVTRSNRIGFDFQDPAGKTLDEYTKEAMMQCVRVAQKMRQPSMMSIAPSWHAVAHRPQPLHLSSSI